MVSGSLGQPIDPLGSAAVYASEIGSKHDKIDAVVDRFYEWLEQQQEFNVFFSSKDTVEPPRLPSPVPPGPL